MSYVLSTLRYFCQVNSRWLWIRFWFIVSPSNPGDGWERGSRQKDGRMAEDKVTQGDCQVVVLHFSSIF